MNSFLSKRFKAFAVAMICSAIHFSGCDEENAPSPVDAIAGVYDGTTHRMNTQRTTICDTTYAFATTLDTLFQSGFSITKVDDDELSFVTPFSTDTFLYNESNHYEAEAALSGPYLKRITVDIAGDSVYTYYLSSSARLVHTTDTCQQIERYAQADTFAGLRLP